MKEIVLPDVGKLAVVRRDPGQDRLRCYRKLGVRLRVTRTATSALSDLARSLFFQPGARRG